MFRKILFYSTLFISTIAWSQIKVLTPSLSFAANELQTDSAMCLIQNKYPFYVTVSSVFTFEALDDYPFFVSDSIFTIPPHSTATVKVFFKPEQNILYQQNIIFMTPNRGGFVVAVSGQGSFSKTYYSSTQNKTEQSLKNELKQITGQGYVVHSYNGARDKMYGSIDNVAGDVECVYTGRTATFNTRSGANSNSFNCEHTWPQSLFSSASPMKSDMHHLFPTDVTSNSQRGSLPFGVVNNPTWSLGGSKKNGSYFEPRDIHKGAVARSMMYFITRYQNYSNFFTAQESILRQWHKTYAPSMKEISRNDAIYAEQNNRNPFVDYPQFTKRITSLSANSVAPSIDLLFLSTDTIQFRDEVSGDSLVYHYVLYNAGNTDIELQGITHSINTDYSILNIPSNVTLEPGESYIVHFYMIKPFSGVHPFTINTDIGDFNSYVRSSPDISLDEWIGSQIEIFPNPTIDHLKVFAPITENLSYQLVDANGNIVLNGVFNGSVTIDTRPLAWGAYYLNIYRNTLLYTEPIIKTSR